MFGVSGSKGLTGTVRVGHADRRKGKRRTVGYADRKVGRQVKKSL